jgi:phosphotransferase system enzyme I (PtsP)
MDELRAKGVAFDERVSLGVMMELPSSVEVAEELAAEADFLSIGSNDLVQYMLAVDRTNEQVSNLYKAHHPAILRAINRIVRAAREAGKEVSICGDLAADVKLLPFLLGIGLRKLSVDMVHAPTLERSLGKIRMADAQKHAQELLKYGRLDQVEAVLEIE